MHTLPAQIIIQIPSKNDIYISPCLEKLSSGGMGKERRKTWNHCLEIFQSIRKIQFLFLEISDKAPEHTGWVLKHKFCFRDRKKVFSIVEQTFFFNCREQKTIRWEDGGDGIKLGCQYKCAGPSSRCWCHVQEWWEHDQGVNHRGKLHPCTGNVSRWRHWQDMSRGPHTSKLFVLPGHLWRQRPISTG